MESPIKIRTERPDDGPTIAEIVKRTYAGVLYSDHREHIMVDRLRGTDAYLPELSLLAEVGGEAVGHILLTKAVIRSFRSHRTSLALAPLSVVPEFRRRGAGKLLLTSACDQAVKLGFDCILVVGIPNYYEQFGFERLSRYPITLPFDAPDENCQILALQAGALDDVAGVVQYAGGWLDH